MLGEGVGLGRVGANQLVDLWGVVRVVGWVAHHHHVHRGAVDLRVLVRWLDMLGVILMVSMARDDVVVVLVVVVPHLVQAVRVPLG